MTRVLSCALLAVGLLYRPRAHAGGLEYTAAGVRALGRGGAVTARAEDPMVLAYNPAGLAELRGSQLSLDLNLAVMSACVDPIGFYGWGVYGGGNKSAQITDPATGENEEIGFSTTPSRPDAVAEAYYREALDTVCMEQSVVPIPQLAFATRVSERLGVGFGLLFPAVQPQGRWGGPHGVIRGASGALRPAPTRYMQLSANNIGVFPTIGAGFRVTERLRVGASFEWGMVAIENRTMAAIAGGTNPANDIEARVTGVDWFVPAATASVHWVPVDAWDVVFAARYQDDIRTPGKIDLTSGLFDPTLLPHTTELDIDEIRQRMPWRLRAGIRYASRLRARPDGTGHDEGGRWRSQPIHDALEDERWDIELDVEYQINSRNQRQVLEYAPHQAVEFKSLDGMIGTAPFSNDIPRTEIEKRWRDQVSIRLGGTYNVIPGAFGISAGAHYETRGVDPNYMQVDFWPVSRVGVHGGVIIRLSGVLDLSLSYARIFQETLIVEPAPHRDGAVIHDTYRDTGLQHVDKRVGPVSTRPDDRIPLEASLPGTPDGQARVDQNLTRLQPNQPPVLVNAGRYRSGFHVFSAGVNVHF